MLVCWSEIFIISISWSKQNSNPFQVIGQWSKATEMLTLSQDEIRWDMFSTNMMLKVPDDSDDNFITQHQNTEKEGSIPESVCSKPCEPWQYLLQKDPICCWECENCRNNEIVVNKSSCELCPTTFWPDGENATNCIPIEPTYMKPSDIIASCLMALTGLSFLATSIIMLTFWKNRKKKLVRASGREFMAIIMFGICSAHVIVFVFMMKPTKIFCYITHFGFNIAVTFLYGPLLVKTNRIYRIFTASDKFKQKIKCVNLWNQMIMIAVILLVQVRS